MCSGSSRADGYEFLLDTTLELTFIVSNLVLSFKKAVCVSRVSCHILVVVMI